MELKDLKQKDLVSFRFSGDKKLHRGIFKELRNNGNPIFVLTDMGYENQEFDKNLFELDDLLRRPAIEGCYYDIKENLFDRKGCELEEQIEELQRKLDELQYQKEKKCDEFVPSLNDVLNYQDY